MRAGVIAALIAVAAFAVLAAVSFTVKNSGGGTSTDDPVIAAAGDIADSGSGDEATARLVDAIAPTAVLTLGDNAYDDGTLAEFNRYYAPTWGRHRRITHPVPGNHDYNTPGAAGYFDYFGRAARDPARAYYSFDLGAWHLIALNSEMPHDMGSAQVAWLKRDLAASGAKCTLAYWHRPRFTAGRYSDLVEYTPFWRALWNANADVVLAGHDHNYQRYGPLDPAGVADSARGIRQFVVGTGGRSHYELRSDSRRVAGTDSVYGVLKLTLHPASFDFSFVPEAGETYSDSGKGIACH
jgi:3',5'-cyclic AMP phosphodiesterase CpdA